MRRLSHMATSLAGNKAAQLHAGPDIRPVEATDLNPPWCHAAGAVISTAHDVHLYAKALGSGELLRSAILYQRGQFVSAGHPSGYGIGVMKGSGGPAVRSGIPARSTASKASLDTKPDKHVIIVVLTNLYLAPHTYLEVVPPPTK